MLLTPSLGLGQAPADPSEPPRERCGVRPKSGIRTIHSDAALIEALGGPGAVVKTLGHESVHRVSNWMRRGIPSAVKVAHPDLFMPGAVAKSSQTSAAPTASTSHFCHCVHIDDAFVMRACGWAAAALAVMAIAGLLP